MRITMFVSSVLILFSLLFSVPPVLATGETGYALVMANGTKIKISEYDIDLEGETIFFKSASSGLAATFPLERISRVVKYDLKAEEIPDDAMPLFIPDKTIVEQKDDGGIPVLFQVKKTVVGSGGSSGYSRGGSSGSSQTRGSYRSSSSKGGSSGVSSSGSSFGTSSSGSTSSGSSSSSGSSNNAFFDALFGGKK